MSDTLRSSDGCWTCRVRRKKCDENNPACLTCTSLQLPCYGYGPKPVWMDRGIREREVAKNLGAIVKQTLSLQRTRISQQSSSTNKMKSDDSAPQPSLRRSSSWDALSGKDIQDTDFILLQSSTIPSYTASDAASNVLNFDSRDSHGANESPQYPTPAAAAIGVSPRKEPIDMILTNDSWSVPPVQFEEDQATLLMHFFDHVLPRQFRFYNPSVLEGGRGWLLSILIRTKPLYQVALSLAAYHQQSILIRGSGILCATSVAKLQERHIECIKELRTHLEKFPVGTQASSCEENIEVMACIVLLIALELFTCGTKDWNVHLQAACSLSLKFGRDPLKKGPSSKTHRLAMAFFKSVVSWYDIFSCATTGLKPFSTFDERIDAIVPHVPFEKLMGCEDWLMRLIHEIATLGEWKKRIEESGGLSMVELVRRASNIEARLEDGLAASGNANEVMLMDTSIDPAISDAAKAVIKKTTHIFAGAALVYLQVTISGAYPGIPEIQRGVSRTMTALDELDDISMVRNLLWPVCIAGCMATEEYEPYWRDLLSSAGNERWAFGYPFKILLIMEECWKLRRSQPGTAVAVDWMTAMKSLDMRLLLV